MSTGNYFSSLSAFSDSEDEEVNKSSELKKPETKKNIRFTKPNKNEEKSVEPKIQPRFKDTTKRSSELKIQPRFKDTSKRSSELKRQPRFKASSRDQLFSQLVDSAIFSFTGKKLSQKKRKEIEHEKMAEKRNISLKT